MVTGQNDSDLEKESSDLFARLNPRTLDYFRRQMASYEPNLSPEERERRQFIDREINREMNLYETSRDPKFRGVLLHRLRGYFTWCPDLHPTNCTSDEHLLRWRFFGLTSVPRFQEDVETCSEYLRDVLGETSTA